MKICFKTAYILVRTNTSQRNQHVEETVVQTNKEENELSESFVLWLGKALLL